MPAQSKKVPPPVPSTKHEKHKWVFRLGLTENQPDKILACFKVKHAILDKSNQIVLFLPLPGTEKGLWELCKKAFFSVPAEDAIRLITDKGIPLIE
jgi:hypothetical protein